MANPIVDIISKNKKLIPLIISVVAIVSYMVPVYTVSDTQPVKADGYGGIANDRGNAFGNNNDNGNGDGNGNDNTDEGNNGNSNGGNSNNNDNGNGNNNGNNIDNGEGNNHNDGD